MKTPKHTQGPWEVTYDGDGCHCDFGYGVLNTIESDELNDLDELKANARLISLAPEMLDLLYRTRTALVDLGLSEMCGPELLAIDSMIKKAEGVES
jgi:hypothetical protein